MPRFLLLLAALLAAGCQQGAGTLSNHPPDLALDPAPPADALMPQTQPDGGDPSLIFVPASTFRMGCQPALDPSCQADESPDHDVTLHAYFIDRTEVTQAAYKACIDAGACTPPTAEFDPIGHAAFPVNDITWDQAVSYCQFAGKRLPTEAEWERAARGTDRRVYPWGNDPPDCAHLNYSAAWPTTTCHGGTVATASHTLGRSAVGAEDMGGNVWEWVSDWYGANYYAVSPNIDPQGPASGTHRAKRGGSWGDPADRVRASRRWFHYTFQAENDIGFRCAR